MSKFSDIINFALDREREAETFYLQVAAKTTVDTLRELFVGFAGEEKKHQQILKEVLENKEAIQQFKPNADYKISETVEKAELNDTMTIADVFIIAMKREEEAMKMYQHLAGDTTSDKSKKIFESLALMEQGHKTKMEKFYSDVAYNEVW